VLHRLGLPRSVRIRPGGGPLIGLEVAAEDSETDFWGYTAADLQDNIEIENGVISGDLNYIADYSAAGFDPADGNFLALKVGSSEDVEDATYVCTIIDGNGTERSVTLDETGQIVIQIKDKDTQKIRFTATKAGYNTDVVTLSLTGLNCEAAPAAEEEA